MTVYFPPALRAERRNAVVEPVRGDRPVRTVQAGQDLGQDVQRVGDRPPYRPECRSPLAPSTMMSIVTRPLDASETDGSVGRHIAPSADTTRSALSARACALTYAGRCGLPTSSSPSNRKLRVQRQAALLGPERLGRLQDEVDRTLVNRWCPAPGRPTNSAS